MKESIKEVKEELKYFTATAWLKLIGSILLALVIIGFVSIVLLAIGKWALATLFG